MRYKTLLIVFILCLCLINVNSIVVCASTDFSDNKVVANVVDPNVKSEVYLTYNEYTDSELFKTNIKIIIKTNGEIIEILTGELSGYNPQIFLGDFLGNGLEQIMLTVDSGGSGGYSYVYVYSVENGEPKQIFNFETYNNQNKFNTSINNNILEISSANKSFLIDLSNKEISNHETYVSCINTVFPCFNTYTNKYYIIVLNKIVGGFEANNYGYVVSLVELNSDSYNIISRGIIDDFNN